MPLSDQEKLGIVDLLYQEQTNRSVLMQLARSVTKNVVDINSAEEALEYVCMHISDSVTLLNKRIITKDMLFKYLHSKQSSVSIDFNKAMLVKRVLELWFKRPVACSNINNSTSNANATVQVLPQSASLIHTSNQNPLNGESDLYQDFPIHLLARKFTEWFFTNYNGDLLKVEDFWSDAKLLMRIAANDGCEENEYLDAESILQALHQVRNKFSFFFNPNVTHAGVQGRMDAYGLVIVLACGTLHTHDKCVGVFECAFGLLRDPFTHNNWKTKNIKIMLRSKSTPCMLTLAESDTLQEALALPIPHGEIT